MLGTYSKLAKLYKMDLFCDEFLLSGLTMVEWDVDFTGLNVKVRNEIIEHISM